MISKAQIPGSIKMFDWSKLPAGWTFELLGNLCRVRRGASPRPAGDPKYFGGHIPWFKIGDATKNGGRFLEKTEEFVNEAGAERSVRLPSGSLIVSNSGVSLGFAVITRVEGCIHDGWLVLDEFKRVHQYYLYYLINYLTSRIRNMADGTTQPNLNTGIAKKLLVPLPPADEQVAIIKILEAFDEKTESNNRINNLLESIVRSIFKSWFVDFDPVRSKAAGLQPAGLDVNTADLFPDKFEDSDFGEIPKGWTIGKVSDIASLSRDSLDPSDFPHELFSYYSIPAFDSRRIPSAELGHRILSNKFVVPDDSVLLSKLNPRIPRVWLTFRSTGNRPVSSTEFFVLLPLPGNTREYLYSFFSSQSFNLEFQKLVTGTSGSHQRVKPEFFLNMRVLRPPERVIRAFSQIVKPLLQNVMANLSQLQHLTLLRDQVLPKLLSGEVRPENINNLVSPKS